MRDVVNIADTLTELMLRYYRLIFTILVLMGLALLWEGQMPRSWREIWSPFVLIGLLVIVGMFVIRPYCYNLIRADIIYKQGGVFAGSNDAAQKQIGIAHYEKSLEYVPREDYYNLFLGKAYLELGQGLPAETPPDQREAVLLKTQDVLTHARELNPLNTDHSANLARFYKSWAARVRADLRAEGLTDAQKATLNNQYETLLRPIAGKLRNRVDAQSQQPHHLERTGAALRAGLWR